MNREVAAALAGPFDGPDAATVTTVFTDIEGSTRLWEQQPQAMRAALIAHDTIAAEVVAAHGGTLIKHTGDGLHAAFADAADAVAMMVTLQRRLAEPASTAGLPLKVRMGAHCGADEWRGGDYYGPDVNRAARVMSVAHGGQILLSQATYKRVGERWPEGVTTRDLGLVRLRDLSEPQALHQVLHPALRADFPALRSLEATPNNLPRQLSRFIGREAESAELQRLLKSHRLVTLLGLGGLGKSRLSVQVGAEVLDAYADGVWLVELAGVVDAALVPHAVAAALGVAEESGLTMTEALERVLHDRRALVILDNCEHVHGACATLAKRLLQATTALTVLATSREALHVGGEVVLELPSLTAPTRRDALRYAPPGAAAWATHAAEQALSPAAAWDLPNAENGPDAAPDGTPPVAGASEAEPPPIQALLAHESVRLFLDRAQAARGDFRLKADTAWAVAWICARLDGIPLALELAAARVRSLPVSAIAERLDDRFALLKSPDRTVLPRQRTLRALIDWSHDLLQPAERALFARLAVFIGGWTLEAAEAIGSAGDDDPQVPRSEVVDLLASLVEKSLVSTEPQTGRYRYRYLETVRAYADEKLAADPAERLAALRRHVDWFVALAERAHALNAGPRQAEALQLFDSERENLAAAQRACHELVGGAGSAVRLVRSQRFYWVHRGQLQLAQQLAEQLLGHPAMSDDPQAHMMARMFVGQLMYYGGHHAAARPMLEQAFELAEAQGDAVWAAGVLQPLGLACLGVGDAEAALRHLNDALQRSRRLDEPREVVAALNALAQAYRAVGRDAEAEPLVAEALSMPGQTGDTSTQAVGRLNLAMLRVGRGAWAEAAEDVRLALRLAREVGSLPLVLCAVEVAAAVGTGLGRPEAAAQLLGASDRHTRMVGLERDPADQQFVDRAGAAVQAAIGTSGVELAAAATAGWDLDALVEAADAILRTG